MDRVLELGGFAAAYCGRLFVQAGCDVVHIEAAERPAAWVSETAMAVYLHAGKRRMRTDDAGLIAELAASADVVILEAGTADAVQASGFDQWQAPVKAAITPFGRTGPRRNWQASANTLLAMGGYTYIMGDPGRAPLTLPGHYPEFQSGAYAFAAANACRYAGERNVIDIGMLEVVMSLSQFTTVLWHCAGQIRQRHGNDYHYVVPINQYRCSDGWLYLAIVPDFWDAFATFLNRPELVLDRRFDNIERRTANRDALHAIIGEALAAVTAEEALARALECRVPIGIVHNLDDVLADPHLGTRGFWQTVRTGAATSLRSPRRAWRVNGAAPAELTLLATEAPDG